ncbi:hypothetical protein [Nocardia lijiangensis]|uniref:hypothetical protein n=1 Tax=Nocardia lijiangensis TaxID=299618 RepID=UPI003D724628
MFSKTNMRRAAGRVAVAGAMVTIPLAAVAATAGAETPVADTVQVQQASEGVVLEGTDVSRPHHPGHHGLGRPGHGGRDFPRTDNDSPGPYVYQQGIPATGSGSGR